MNYTAAQNLWSCWIPGIQLLYYRYTSRRIMSAIRDVGIVTAINYFVYFDTCAKKKTGILGNSVQGNASHVLQHCCIYIVPGAWYVPRQTLAARCYVIRLQVSPHRSEEISTSTYNMYCAKKLQERLAGNLLKKCTFSVTIRLLSSVDSSEDTRTRCHHIAQSTSTRFR